MNDQKKTFRTFKFLSNFSKSIDEDGMWDESQQTVEIWQKGQNLSLCRIELALINIIQKCYLIFDQIHLNLIRVFLVNLAISDIEGCPN